MMIKEMPLLKMKPKPKGPLGFGQFTSDRMFVAEWQEGRGWFNAQIKPYEPFVFDPSTLVFHYAQEIFEGLKAYKWADGSLALFRPEMNAKRFAKSAERLAMPEVPESLFLEAIERLVALESDWVPTEEGTSLYIRPTMIAVEPVLGVRPSSSYLFYVILSPVGAYYRSGFKPVKILVEDTYVRAVAGGTGEAKTGANYASSIKAGVEAKKMGYEQVLWLDGVHRRYIEEVGAMNVFFMQGDKVITPVLNGSILHGITRDSVIQLARSWGLEIEERRVDVQELTSGSFTEAFGSGTAAVISPIGELCYKGTSFLVNNGQIGRWTQKFYDTLTAIQTGKGHDSFNWVKKVQIDSRLNPTDFTLKTEQPVNLSL